MKLDLLFFLRAFFFSSFSRSQSPAHHGCDAARIFMFFIHSSFGKGNEMKNMVSMTSNEFSTNERRKG